MTTDRYLFRGFHKDENGKETIYLNGKVIKGIWLYGYLVCSEDYIFDYSERIDIPYIIPTNNFNLKDYRQYEVIPETTGQYCGLDDKNDVKIFEKDTVKNKWTSLAGINIGSIWEVKFGEYDNSDIEYGSGGNIGFYAYNIKDGNEEGLNNLPYDENESIEVIGTKFDKEVK